MSLSVRKPTGEAAWPNLLIEGKEGAGKTYSCLRLSADPRVGTTYVVEVGERRADEYAALGDFYVVEHDGSLRQIVSAIREVLVQPPEGGRPNVLVIDSMTALWDLVKREAERLARSTDAAKRTLEKDPEADVTIGHAHWNKAKDWAWWGWINDLRGWPGLALLTARADEVSKFVDNRPVANQTSYRVDIESGTPFALDGTVRMRLGAAPKVMTAKSLRFRVPAEGLELPEDEPLAHLIFELYGAGTEVLLSVAQAKAALLSHCRAVVAEAGVVRDPDGIEATARSMAQHVWEAEHRHAASFDADAMARLLDAVQPPDNDHTETQEDEAA